MSMLLVEEESEAVYAGQHRGVFLLQSLLLSIQRSQFHLFGCFVLP
jgi:hypothetical protein